MTRVRWTCPECGARFETGRREIGRHLGESHPIHPSDPLVVVVSAKDLRDRIATVRRATSRVKTDVPVTEDDDV